MSKFVIKITILTSLNKSIYKKGEVVMGVVMREKEIQGSNKKYSKYSVVQIRGKATRETLGINIGNNISPLKETVSNKKKRVESPISGIINFNNMKPDSFETISKNLDTATSRTFDILSR